MSLPRLPHGAFVGFPDLFRSDEHLLILEDPYGTRYVQRAITGSYGPGVANVGAVPSGRVFLRIDGDTFMDDAGTFHVFLKGCPDRNHMWEHRITLQHVWEQCSWCGAPRQPIR